MSKAFYNTKQAASLDEKHIMLDLETFGVSHNAPIIQIGICTFDGKGIIFDQFKATIDLAEIDLSQADASTIKWWFNREIEAINSIKKGNMKPAVAFAEANNFIKEVQAAHKVPQMNIWCHATFDTPILTNSFKKYDILPNFKYYQVKDIRTLNWLSGDVETKRDGVRHDALDDAIFQAKYCAEMMQKIIEAPKPRTVRL